MSMNKEVVILLHGFCGTSEGWSETARSLAKDFEVLTPDWPGFGSRGADAPLESIEQMADHVVQIADRAGIARFHLVGHSMSGFVVQHLLLEHPHRVGRAVLYGTFAAMEDGGRFETVMETVAKLNHDGLEPTVNRIVTSWFIDGAAHSKHARCIEQGLSMSLSAARAAMIACDGVDFRGRLANIRAPVLVILGEKDRTVRLDAAIALARGVDAGCLCVLPRAAHAAHLEQQELFNLAVRRFLLAAS